MVVFSNLQNCHLIWLFCSKTVDNLIKRVTKHAMGISYNSDNEEELDAILQRDGTLTIHKKAFQKLKVEIHKTNKSSIYMRSFHQESDGV